MLQNLAFMSPPPRNHPEPSGLGPPHDIVLLYLFLVPSTVLAGSKYFIYIYIFGGTKQKVIGAIKKKEKKKSS